METIAGDASKLNKIIERPNRDHHIKTRISLGLQAFLSTKIWFFVRDCTVHVKQELAILESIQHILQGKFYRVSFKSILRVQMKQAIVYSYLRRSTRY